MTHASRAIVAAGLTASFALAPTWAVAQCRDWDGMLADGSLVQIEAVLGDEIDLTLSVVYLNPKRLGAQVS